MIDLNLLFNNGNSKYYFLKILKTFKYIENKWQKYWKENKTYKVFEDKDKNI